MKMLSQRTLERIDDLVRVLNFEANTGQHVTLQVSQNIFDMESFSRRRLVYLNGQEVGEVVEEIVPFV
jgi:hypothetical protein